MGKKLLAEVDIDLREQAIAAIRGRLDRTLIGVRGLGPVRVWHLWDGHYRVNVYGDAGPAADRMTNGFASATIAHSFFVVVDETGTILASTPELPRPVA